MTLASTNIPEIKENPPVPLSKTALVVAMLRARASRAEPPLCQDPWAGALAGPEGERALAEVAPLPEDIERGVAVRTSFLDAQVRRFFSGGHGGPVHAGGGPMGPLQVLILGAGLDSRAARFAEAAVGPRAARFFEVDVPAVVAYKRQRAAALAGYPVEAACYVPCEFGRESFLPLVLAAGLLPEWPALVLMEGVASFLPAEVLEETLSQVARRLHPETVVALDFLTPALPSGVRHGPSPKLLWMRDHVRSVGEPMEHLDADPPPPLQSLHRAGMRYVRRVGFHELHLAQTGRYDAGLDLFEHWACYLASRGAAALVY